MSKWLLPLQIVFNCWFVFEVIITFLPFFFLPQNPLSFFLSDSFPLISLFLLYTELYKYIIQYNFCRQSYIICWKKKITLRMETGKWSKEETNTSTKLPLLQSAFYFGKQLIFSFLSSTNFICKHGLYLLVYILFSGRRKLYSSLLSCLLGTVIYQ